MPTMGSAGAAPAGPDSTAHSAVLQDSTAGIALKCVAAKTAQTVTTSLASVLVEQASLG